MVANSFRIFVRFALIAALALICGCQSGGTDGTGVPKTIVQGSVQNQNGERISGATLQITSSGETTQTNEEGEFQLEWTEQSPSITFSITRDDFEATATLENLPTGTDQLSVSIAVDTVSDTADAQLIRLSEVKEFGIRAKIVGACSKKFKNVDGRIRQSRHLSNGTNCEVKVKVFGDGEPKGGVKVAIQRRPCVEKEPWITTEVRITSTRQNEGEVRIPFKFFTTKRACEYRIRAPFGQDEMSHDTVEIVTLQKQEQR